MATLIGIKNPSEYSELDNSAIQEKPAILNPVSARWYPSRGDTKVSVKEAEVRSPGYSMIPQKFNHPNPGRNALGIVGGNEVSLSSGNIVDTESELYGITRNISRTPAKQYIPSCPLGDNKCPSWPKSFHFKERATGIDRTISTKPQHLPTIQMFGYPGIPAPKPLSTQVYAAPWRF